MIYIVSTVNQFEDQIRLDFSITSFYKPCILVLVLVLYIKHTFLVFLRGLLIAHFFCKGTEKCTTSVKHLDTELKFLVIKTIRSTENVLLNFLAYVVQTNACA